MPSKSMSPMPIQTKIGDASLKFGPDWLRALSSHDSATPGSGPTGSGPGGWSSGSGGGGGSVREGGSYSSAASSNQHHQQHHQYSSSNSTSHREGRGHNNSVTTSSGTSSGNTSTNRFQLPEFGYGREEMLALFDKNLPPPDFLPAFGTLYIEKMQPPLAFSQPSEEELRVWHVPQPESSRQSTVGPPPVGRGGYSVRGGRGISSDRGRGRGGRGGYYGRPHEEEDRSFSRAPRTFERSQSAHERVWVERNGGGNGPAPPPQEDGGARGSWRARENFSNKRYENDGDGWRRPSWRNEDEEPRSHSRRLHKSWSDDGTHEGMPEWLTSNPSEESGTFDSSGAFHEEDRYSAKSNAFEQSRRDLEKNSRESKGESEPYGSQNDRVQKRAPERNDKKAVIHSPVMEEDPSDLSPDIGRLNNTSHESRYRTPSESAPDVSNVKAKLTPLRNDEPSVPQQKQAMHHPEFTDRSHESVSPHQTPPLSDSDAANRTSSNQTQSQSRLQQPTIDTRIPPNAARNFNSIQEEHYYSMAEEADMVAKLIEDDGSLAHFSSPSVPTQPPSASIPIMGNTAAASTGPTNHTNKISGGNINANISAASLRPSPPLISQQQTPVRPPSPGSFEVWFYRDPQGSVQGPFTTHEMAQWYHQGYFTGSLLLRRECDKTFITLSEMGKLYCRNPFLLIPDAPMPPPLLDPSALDNPSEPSLVAQYHQRLLQQQQQQQYHMKLNQSGIRKEGEPWQGQVPLQQQQVNQSANSRPEGTNPSPAQLQAQMLLNLAKQAGVVVNDDNPNPIEHLQAIFNRQAQVKGNDITTNNKNEFINSAMVPPQMNAQMDVRKSPTQGSPDPIQSLVQQLTNMVNLQQYPPKTVPKAMEVSPHWGGSSVPTLPPVQHQFNNWATQTQGPSQNQMWEYREQFLKLQQQKMEGEMLKQKKEEELERKRLAEEEERKRQEEQQRLEVEEHRKELKEQYMLQKKQEEIIKQQQQAAEMARQKEALIQQQRLHQQELERQQQRFEQQRQEQQRLEQQRLEQQRQEQQRMEQLRQEQQEREEQRRLQQEREEQQQQLRLQQQEHEEKQRQHQLRIQQEQEQQEAAKQKELQQKFSWISSPVQQQVQPVEAPPALSLLEIQQEEAIKEHENTIRQQAAKKTKQLQQEQAKREREAKSGLSLKWAQTAQPQKVVTKSFAEIQAEEQAKLSKQQEKDREQRAIVNQSTQLQQVWSSSLTWANRASLNAPPTTPKLNGGIWDDPPNLGAATASGKQAKPASTTSSNSSPSNAGGNTSSNKQTASAPAQQQGQGKRGKESDEAFLKLFQEHGMKNSRTQSQHQPQDEFTRWCFETVEGIGGGIDIATFVSFLKEVESPYEVNDYVRSYLGDGRDAREFGKEFLERRSRWKNARKGQDKDGEGFEDNLCRPAYAVNPTQSEFQEVKVKGKKGKKGKMQKVDSRILGFNTTSAPDRVNVGKRDYGDGTD